MSSLVFYIIAAFAEIAGCFAIWAVVRLGAPGWWTLPGMLALLIFGWLLTRVDVDFAGRAYAAYGGIYICASLTWLWAVEFARPGPLGSRRRLPVARRSDDDPVRAPIRVSRDGYARTRDLPGS